MGIPTKPNYVALLTAESVIRRSHIYWIYFLLAYFLMYREIQETPNRALLHHHPGFFLYPKEQVQLMCTQERYALLFVRMQTELGYLMRTCVPRWTRSCLQVMIPQPAGSPGFSTACHYTQSTSNGAGRRSRGSWETEIPLSGELGLLIPLL